MIEPQTIATIAVVIGLIGVFVVPTCFFIYFGKIGDAMSDDFKQAKHK